MRDQHSMSMRDRYASAFAFPDYLETVHENEALWRAVYERARVADEVLDAARRVPGVWRLLALSEDWCGDAANILPVIARFAEGLPNVEMRVLSRDDNPDLMDAHLTGGKSRSIPVVMLLNAEWREAAWWGPRPAAIQAWVTTEGLKLDPGPRYAKTRALYARDKGKSILAEILKMMQAAARDVPGSPAPTKPSRPQ